MKSVFLLCEYGISYNTIFQLYERNITLEDIISNNDIIDNILGTGEKKNQILLNIDKAYSRSDNFSVYDLIEFGLSKKIVEFLFKNQIHISDIDETIREKYDISEITYNKIINAIHLMTKSKKITLNLTSFYLYSLIKSKFNNSNFTIYELIDLIESKHYKYDDETLLLLEELIRQKKIIKSGNSFYIPYKTEDLKKYGLSNLLVNFLNENNVKLSNIPEKNFALPFEVLPSKYNKVLEIFNKFRRDTNYKLELTDENMITLIKNYFQNEPFKIEQLIDKIEECGFLKNNLDNLITNAIENNLLKKKNDMFLVVYPTLKEELEKINNKNFHKDMVVKKLSGMTLEQIGDEYGVTRERIRQIVTKELNKISNVSEEEYKHYFIKYNIDLETFTKLFNLSEDIYYYFREKYKMGDSDLSELLNDDELSEEQKEIIRDKFNLIKLYDEHIVVTKTNILVSILKNNEKQLSFEELRIKYNEVIEQFNLDLPLINAEEYRNIDAVLGRNEFVLNTIGRKYRYYNCKDADDDNKNELYSLLDVDAGVYSSELFFNNNPLLMKELNILDEYELHNLMRKILEPKEGIVYSRMPDIYINCEDKYKFVESLIQELSPVNVDEFTEFVYQSYGHKQQTFKAYLQTFFTQYIDFNVLVSESPKFNEEQFEFMSNYLKNDFYSVTTIKELLTEKFDVQDFRLLNNLNFYDLGYKVRGNYIMKSSINNVENYLRELIDSVDFYEIPPEIKKLGSTFTSYIYKMIYDRKIFKYDDRKYITIRKLEQMGITEDDIDDFIEKVNDIIPYNKYFNLYILNTDFENKLLDLDLPECFYETLIMTIPNVKTFRLKNNTLFIKTDDNATREKFINSFVVKDKTYISEIRNQIKTIYNIELQDYYIKEFINRNKFYLNNSTDCVYLNKEIYESEIKQWDILQYID